LKRKQEKNRKGNHQRTTNVSPKKKLKEAKASFKAGIISIVTTKSGLDYEPIWAIIYRNELGVPCFFQHAKHQKVVLDTLFTITSKHRTQRRGASRTPPGIAPAKKNIPCTTATKLRHSA
jgi:hypothetical protein